MNLILYIVNFVRFQWAVVVLEYLPHYREEILYQQWRIRLQTLSRLMGSQSNVHSDTCGKTERFTTRQSQSSAISSREVRRGISRAV